jgi:uncharacterized membrane-anchored protein
MSAELNNTFTVRDGLNALGHDVDPLTEHKIKGVLEGPPQLPLPVRVLLGLGIWLGAGMVVGILDVVDHLLDEEAVRLFFGVVFFGAAAWVSRRQDWGDVRVHLTVLAVVLAEVLVGSTFPSKDTHALLLFTLMQGVIVLVVANSLSRFTAPLLGVFSLWLLGNEEMRFYRHDLPFNDLLVLGLAAAATVLWLARDRLLGSRLRHLQMPLGYSSAVALVGVCAIHLMITMGGKSSWHSYAWPAFLAAGLGVLGLGVGWVVVRELHGRGALKSPHLPLALVAFLVLLSVTSWKTPEVLAAFLLIGLGHARRERGLYALGLLLFGFALFGFYWELKTSLLLKSGMLAGTGTALLLVWAWLVRIHGDLGRKTDKGPVLEHQGLSYARSVAVPNLHLPKLSLKDGFVGRRPVAAVACAVALSLGVPLALAAEKEAALRSGQTILLELAPKDPRSIMQGDYMVLRYEAEGQVRASTPDNLHYAIFVLDDRGVARFGAPDDGVRALAENEVRVRVRKRGHHRKLRLGPPSFFFEEGTGHRYDAARFGEMRLDPITGDLLLVGLRDAQLSKL